MHRNNRRTSKVLTVAGTALGSLLLGAAVAAAAHPAQAAATLAALNSAVTCAATTACVSGTNTGSGPGVGGTSASGYGVRGSSTSGVAGVTGTTAGHDGVYGYTTNSSLSSKGVYGVSPSGFGLYGYSPNDGGYGVEGSGYSEGVVGTSSNGNAFYGVNNVASAATLYANNASGGDGIDVVTQQSTCVNGCSGVHVQSQDGYLFYGLTGNGGVPIYFENSDSGALIFYVSNTGDINYSGNLNNFSRTSNGTLVKSFSSKTTAPTIEDEGTAQLVAGAAVVRLDSTFAASIDRRSTYRVYVTPNGDTHTLFVPTKTASGFVVREAQGGRSTVSFDYRIVATALNAAGQRMAPVNPATLRPKPTTLTVNPVLKAP